MKALLLILITSLFVSSNILSQDTIVSGYILEIEGDKIYIDLTATQVKVGDELEVIKAGGYFTHPVKQKRIKRVDEVIADLRIINAYRDYSIAKSVSVNNNSVLKKGMIVKFNAKNPIKYTDDRKSIAIQPLVVSNTMGFLGVYVSDVLTEKMLSIDDYKILDRQALGLNLERYLVNNREDHNQIEFEDYTRKIGAKYYITGTMYQPDVIEISSGVPVKDLVNIAGFAAKTISGKDLNVDAISSFVPERVEMKKLRAIVKITLKVVEVSTGEILFMCTEMQEANGESELNLEGGMLGGLKLNGGASTFYNTITGKATDNALSNCVDYIDMYLNGNIDSKVYTGNIITIGTSGNNEKSFPKIIELENINDKVVATINKGSESKSKGGKVKAGNKYFLYEPKYLKSAISGNTVEKGSNYIGKLIIDTADFDASSGIVNFTSQNSTIKINSEELVLKPVLYPSNGDYCIFVRNGVAGAKDLKNWIINFGVKYLVSNNYSLGLNITSFPAYIRLENLIYTSNYDLIDEITNMHQSPLMLALNNRYYIVNHDNHPPNIYFLTRLNAFFGANIGYRILDLKVAKSHMNYYSESKLNLGGEFGINYQLNNIEFELLFNLQYLGNIEFSHQSYGYFNSILYSGGIFFSTGYKF